MAISQKALTSSCGSRGVRTNAHCFNFVSEQNNALLLLAPTSSITPPSGSCLSVHQLSRTSIMTLRPLLFFAVGVLVSCSSTAVHQDKSKTTPYGGKPHVIPGTFEAEHYDEGQPGKAYVDVDEKNHGAPYREGTQVDIEPRPDASNGYGIGWIKAGEWVVYTIDVREAGRYIVEVKAASAKEGGTFHLEIDGQPITEPIHVASTGSWKKLGTLKAKTVPLSAGVQRLKVVMDTEGEETNWVADIDIFRFTKMDG